MITKWLLYSYPLPLGPHVQGQVANTWYFTSRAKKEVATWVTWSWSNTAIHKGTSKRCFPYLWCLKMNRINVIQAFSTKSLPRRRMDDAGDLSSDPIRTWTRKKMIVCNVMIANVCSHVFALTTDIHRPSGLSDLSVDSVGTTWDHIQLRRGNSERFSFGR